VEGPVPGCPPGWSPVPLEGENLARIACYRKAWRGNLEVGLSLRGAVEAGLEAARHRVEYGRPTEAPKPPTLPFETFTSSVQRRRQIEAGTFPPKRGIEPEHTKRVELPTHTYVGSTPQQPPLFIPVLVPAEVGLAIQAYFRQKGIVNGFFDAGQSEAYNVAAWAAYTSSVDALSRIGYWAGTPPNVTGQAFSPATLPKELKFAPYPGAHVQFKREPEEPGPTHIPVQAVFHGPERVPVVYDVVQAVLADLRYPKLIRNERFSEIMRGNGWVAGGYLQYTNIQKWVPTAFPLPPSSRGRQRSLGEF
jgi:hypothetical protein